MKQSQVLSSFIWRFFEKCGQQIVSFIVSVILARLLDTSDYGTLALVAVFTSILNVFINSGMGMALIQKKGADDLDFSSLFYFNVCMCAALYILLFLAAPLIAKFYNDAELTLIIRILGISLLISGVHSIQGAYVSKHLLYRKTFISTLGSNIFSGVVGIVMAYAGFGIWALVTQSLLSSFASTVIIWIIVPWRPKWMFSFNRLKGLFSFGWKMLVSSLIDTGYNDLRTLIIGKMYSANDLAFYNKGSQFPNLIVSNVNASINSVLLPTMAKEQEDKARVKAMARRAIRLSTYIMAPLMVGLAVCAEPIVKLVLTEKWLPSVFYLRIFCITYMFWPIHTANLSAIQALGRSDYYLKLEIVKKCCGITLILSTMWISVEAMAYSLLVNALLSTIINSYPNKKLLNYNWGQQMKDILPNILLAVVMGIPVFLLQFLPLPTIIILFTQVIIGALIYIGLSVIFRLEIFRYLLDIVKGFFKRNQKN